MLVYVVRHAIAVERGATDMPDEARPLTEKGRRRFAQGVRGLARLRVEIEEIWTSPLTRAIQTAEILSQLHGFKGTTVTVDSLAPGGDATRTIGQLSGAKHLQAVAIVGHEPDLSAFASRLLAGSSDSFVLLKKGAIACIDVEDSNGRHAELQWLMQPRSLRRLG